MLISKSRFSGVRRLLHDVRYQLYHGARSCFTRLMKSRVAFLTLCVTQLFAKICPKNHYCVLLSFRLSDPDERAILNEEADLCVTSCLHILKAVTKSYSNYDLVLECLKNIEACVSFLQDTATLNEGNKTLLERIKQVVEESFQISTKWCKRYLPDHKFPCHDMVKADKELQVCTCCPFKVSLIRDSR